MKKPKHVWIVTTNGYLNSTVIFGVFETWKKADMEVRAMMKGAKYNRGEQVWYNDNNYDWYSVVKEEVQ